MLMEMFIVKAVMCAYTPDGSCVDRSICTRYVKLFVHVMYRMFLADHNVYLEFF